MGGCPDRGRLSAFRRFRGIQLHRPAQQIEDQGYRAMNQNTWMTEKSSLPQ